MTYDLLYSGFDTLYVAFQGALPEKARRLLRKAKARAADEGQAALIAIGPGKVDMHVQENGSRGGYAFVCDTGSLGETWLFKDNGDANQWNIFVNVDAKSLLAAGYHETRRRLFQTLQEIDCRVITHAINRIDYAMDFLAPDFEPNLDLFVTPPGTTVKPHWADGDGQARASAVFANRRIQSVTVGSSKLRQVIIYDKRRDSLDKRKLFWFKQWDIDPKDRSKAVWRVELRAGKQELKGRFRIATFDDLEAAIGDVYKIMAEQIRYVAEDQTDTNVTRQELHPLWRKVCEHVQFAMADKQSGLTRDQIKEIERDEAIDNATTMITAYAINMGIATGLSDEKIDEDLQKLVTAALSAQRDLNKGKFNKRVRRARERMHFIRR